MSDQKGEVRDGMRIDGDVDSGAGKILTSTLRAPFWAGYAGRVN